MKYVVYEDIEARGASKALYRTMKDIDRIIIGLPLPKAGPLRERLRSRIRRAIHEGEEWYYRTGYRRGVYAAADVLGNKGKILGTVKKVMRVHFTTLSEPKRVVLIANPEQRKKSTSIK